MLSSDFFLFMKDVHLEFYFLNKLVSPPSFPAVGNLSQMSYESIYVYEKHVIAHALFVYFSL